jgi:hypothetical protein
LATTCGIRGACLEFFVSRNFVRSLCKLLLSFIPEGIVSASKDIWNVLAIHQKSLEDYVKIKTFHLGIFNKYK